MIEALPSEIKKKWSRLLDIYNAIYPPTHKLLLKLNQREIIVLIATLDGLSNSEIESQYGVNNSSARKSFSNAAKKLGLREEMVESSRMSDGIPSSRMTNKYQIPVAKMLSVYLAVENFPNADILVKEILDRNNLLGNRQGTIEFKGEYEVVNELIVRAILPARQLSKSQNGVRITYNFPDND